MYAPNVLRSLINYRDLKVKNIHVCTAMQNDEEVLELKQMADVPCHRKNGRQQPIQGCNKTLGI